jgi:uncharacterized repeat protein (TIGR01451 family)
MRTTTLVRRWVAVLALACGVIPGAASTAAANQRVTFAARVCDSYSQIFANEARNNIMESLQQLGPATPYSSTAQMDPLIETLPPQDACRALMGWRFTLGTAIAAQKLNGVWGSLSQVANAYSTVIATAAATPMLGPSGAPSGGSINGAVTIELTDDQQRQAARSSLWVMGGTSAAPVGDATQYAFGALRCAVDNLNGDNVEFVSYPSQVQHVYCFAYYVSPPRGSGRIVVRKHIAGVPATTPAQTFDFRGNVSFANNDPANHPDDGTFTLTASPSADGSATFVREAGSLWNFREIPTSPSLASTTVSCASANHTSTITNPDPAHTLGVKVLLADGDTVTCTYTNTFKPPQVGLVVRKITRGGVGTFPFTVSGFAPFTLTTVEPGRPAQRTVLADAGSTHTITETLPDSDKGTWVAETPFCGGEPAAVRRGRGGSTASITVTIPEATETTPPSLVCTFTNRFVPNGVIRVHKVTRGGTATAVFWVQPQFGTPLRRIQRATTTAPETPALAQPDGPADATTALPLGSYTIQELNPFIDNGTWNLVAVVCDQTEPEPADSGAIRITLTPEDPEVDCTYTDELAPEPPEPPPLPTPVPVPPVIAPLPPPQIRVAGVTAESSPVPRADLVMTKVASPRRVVVGRNVRYLLTIRNRGPATARNVAVVEVQSANRRILRLNASKGACRGSVPRFCVLGSLRRGESATVRVTTRAGRVGRFVNIAAAVTSTQVRTRRTMRAVARVRVVRSAGARFTG